MAKSARSIMILIILIISLLISSVGFAAVRVKGYYRKDGTYVKPHYRSNPDGNPYNNWSYPGNTNPYTGETASGDPDTYLRNYYDKNSQEPSFSLEYDNKPKNTLENWNISNYPNYFYNDNYASDLLVIPGKKTNVKIRSYGSLIEISTAKLSADIYSYPIEIGIGSVEWMSTIHKRWTKEQIANLQGFLNELGYYGYTNTPLIADGSYGFNTLIAHLAYFENR